MKKKTTHVEVDGVLCHATPLVRKKDMRHFHANKDVVMSSLRSTKRWWAKVPEQIKAYNAEIQKLVQASFVLK